MGSGEKSILSYDSKILNIKQIKNDNAQTLEKILEN